MKEGEKGGKVSENSLGPVDSGIGQLWSHLIFTYSYSFKRSLKKCGKTRAPKVTDHIQHILMNENTITSCNNCIFDVLSRIVWTVLNNHYIVECDSSPSG